MALFKINRGNSSTLPPEMTDGWAYFCTDTGEFFIDYTDSEKTLHRKQINANEAKKIVGINGSEGQFLSFDASGNLMVADAPLPEDAITIDGGATITFSEDFGEGPYVLEFTEEVDEILPATLVDYDNSSSKMNAENVQAAIDELKSEIVTLDERVADTAQLNNVATIDGGATLVPADTLGEGPYVFDFTEEANESLPAIVVDYDNSNSGMDATNVQAAIDELKSEIASGVPSVSASDNGKFMCVVDGVWAAVAITDVSEVGA